MSIYYMWTSLSFFFNGSQDRSKDESSKVNSDQEIKDQLRTAQIKRSKFKDQRRSKN